MKITLTKLLFCISLLITFIGSSLAQPLGGIGAIATDDEGWPPVFQVESCETTMILAVRLANLELALPESGPNGEEYLPLDVPPMFLEYSINGGLPVVVEVTTFKYTTTVNNTLLYHTEIETIPVDITEICANPNQFGISFMPYTLRLLEEVEDQFGNMVYQPYPACDFSGPSDIFSCSVFDYAQTPCYIIHIPHGFNDIEDNQELVKTTISKKNGSNEKIEITPCNNDGLTSYSSSVRIECLSCDTPESPNDRNDQEDKDLLKQQKNELSIIPNPFRNKVKVKWSGDLIEAITLYNTNGKVIKFWEGNQANDLSNSYLDLSELPNGLYFLKVNTINSSEVIKLIKQ